MFDYHFHHIALYHLNKWKTERDVISWRKLINYECLMGIRF